MRSTFRLYKLFYLISILFFTLFAFADLNVVQASELGKNQRWVCLGAKRCNTQGSNCAQNSGGVKGHRVRLLSNGKLSLNADSYIVECINTDRGQICTTGHPGQSSGKIGRVESKLPGTNSQFANLRYQFQGLFRSDGVTNVAQPIRSNAAGNFSIDSALEWQSRVNHSHDHKFFALSFFDNTAASGSQGGDQNATFSFDVANEKCESIRWDPLGTVFDVKTLEPVSNVWVTLMKKNLATDNYQKFILTGVINPIYTKIDGNFSFVVPNGVYKLNVSNPSYSFPVNETSINSNWMHIYSNLYFGDDIVESGKVEYRDIPVLPAGPSIGYPAKLMDYAVSLDKATGDTVIEGKLSHPFSQVSVYTNVVHADGTKLKGRLLKQGSASKKGRFKFIIEATSLLKNESCCSVTYHKIDLTGDLSGVIQNRKEKETSSLKKKGVFFNLISFLKPIFNRPISAQLHEGSFSFDQILNYVEGYAYDASGNPMPNATVGIYLKSATSPYFETKADKNGYFKIASENLPFLPYSLKYTSPMGRVISTTTTQFLAKNKDYIKKNDIQVLTYRSEDGSKPNIVMSPTTVSSQEKGVPKTGGNQAGNSNNGPVNTSPIPGMNTSNPNSFMLAVGIILLLLLAISISILSIYYYNKKKKEDGEL